MICYTSEQVWSSGKDARLVKRTSVRFPASALFSLLTKVVVLRHPLVILCHVLS